MLKQELTVTIYTENNIGLLNRVATMFSRRRINIDSLNVAASEAEGIHRFTIVVFDTKDVIKKLCLQIEKQVEVFKCFYHTNEEIVWQEQALYKIANSAANRAEAEKLLREYGARRITGTDDNYTVFETTGTPETTNALVKVLEPLGLTEFVKSARIAIIKSSNTFYQKLKQFESRHPKEESDNNKVPGVENNVFTLNNRSAL